MIELIEDLPSGTVGFSFSGEVCGSDYDNVLVPAIDAALDQHGRIKALLVFGEGFEGYTLEAAWDDTRLGLRHWDGFERLAIVTDVAWLRHALRAIAVLLPAPMRLFADDELEQARRWLSESLGTIHLDSDASTVTVTLIGRLDPEAYRRIEDDLANVVSRHDPLHLLLDLRQFEGWQGLAALAQHLSLISEYRRIPRRVAVIGAHRWQHAAQRLLSRFVNAQTRYFDSDQLAEARQWLLVAG